MPSLSFRRLQNHQLGQILAARQEQNIFRYPTILQISIPIQSKIRELKEEVDSKILSLIFPVRVSFPNSYFHHHNYRLHGAKNFHN